MTKPLCWTRWSDYLDSEDDAKYTTGKEAKDFPHERKHYLVAGGILTNAHAGLVEYGFIPSKDRPEEIEPVAVCKHCNQVYVEVKGD